MDSVSVLRGDSETALSGCIPVVGSSGVCKEGSRGRYAGENNLISLLSPMLLYMWSSDSSSKMGSANGSLYDRLLEWLCCLRDRAMAEVLPMRPLSSFIDAVPSENGSLFSLRGVPGRLKVLDSLLLIPIRPPIIAPTLLRDQELPTPPSSP